MHQIRFGRPARGLEAFVRCYAQEVGEVRGAVHPVHARATPILGFTLGDQPDVESLDGKPRRTTHNSDLIGMQTHRRLHLHVRGAIDSFSFCFSHVGPIGSSDCRCMSSRIGILKLNPCWARLLPSFTSGLANAGRSKNASRSWTSFSCSARWQPVLLMA